MHCRHHKSTLICSQSNYFRHILLKLQRDIGRKRQKTEHNFDSVECDIEHNKYCSNYERSLIPMEHGVEVDEIITRVCREGTEQFLPARENVNEVKGSQKKARFVPGTK